MCPVNIFILYLHSTCIAGIFYRIIESQNPVKNEKLHTSCYTFRGIKLQEIVADFLEKYMYISFRRNYSSKTFRIIELTEICAARGCSVAPDAANQSGQILNEFY